MTYGAYPARRAVAVVSDCVSAGLPFQLFLLPLQLRGRQVEGRLGGIELLSEVVDGGLLSRGEMEDLVVQGCLDGGASSLAGIGSPRRARWMNAVTTPFLCAQTGRRRPA